MKFLIVLDSYFLAAVNTSRQKGKRHLLWKQIIFHHKKSQLDTSNDTVNLSRLYSLTKFSLQGNGSVVITFEIF